MQILIVVLSSFLSFVSTKNTSSLSEPIVTAEKFIEYKKNNGLIVEFVPSQVIPFIKNKDA